MDPSRNRARRTNEICFIVAAIVRRWSIPINDLNTEMQDVDFRLILRSNVKWQVSEKVLRCVTAPVYLMD